MNKEIVSFYVLRKGNHIGLIAAPADAGAQRRGENFSAANREMVDAGKRKHAQLANGNTPVRSK